jgi:hypothetical protein
MIPGKPRLKFRGVEVIAGAGACDAARALKNVRLLTAEVPLLPLETCAHPTSCRCIYRHFDDRRQGPRRESEHASLIRVRYEGSEQRRRIGRRESDYL